MDDLKGELADLLR